MTTRTDSLLAIRPHISSAKVYDTMSAEESFQNKTLRPIIKMQNDLFLGTRYANGANEGLDGSMDEVAIWNKVLQLEDVQTIYNATNDNPGKCANLFTGGLGTDLVFWNRMGD